MDLTVNIPDELARLVGTTDDIERRVLETLALDEYRLGHLSRAQLRRLLGFATSIMLDEFLATIMCLAPTRWPTSSATGRICNDSVYDGGTAGGCRYRAA